MENKKVFVCVTFHHSSLRPQGRDIAIDFCQAWRQEQLPYELLIVDNQSTCTYDDILTDIDHHFIRIDDQLKNKGITGAWNLMCRYSIEHEADIITGFADDVQVNSTLRHFVDAIQDDNTIYGPLTDGVGGPWAQHQKSIEPRPGYSLEVSWVNGFWLGFTSQFWKDKQVAGDLFDFNATAHMDFWAGQEYMIDVWRNRYNTKARVIGDCWMHHTKTSSWQQAREKFNNSSLVK